MPITDFVDYIKEGQKWKLQSHGLWSDEKPLKDLIKDFKKNDLVLTPEKMNKINGR